MRKLSKKISMLMVLAMLVSLFSGIVSASAASAWSFASSKYDVDVKETITMDKNEYADFDLYKEGKEVTKATYTVKWESSDEDVVWVNAKTGQLRADKFGVAEAGDKAKISATFTNVATKKSATRYFYIEIADAAKYAIVADIADEAYVAGEKYALAAKVTADGKEVAAKVEFTVDGAAATEFAPAKAGEYTIIATATIDGKAVATEKFVATVIEAGLVSAKQTAYNAVALTFGSADAAKAVAADTSKLSAVWVAAGSNEITTFIKGVKVDAKNAAVVNVELYNSIVKDTTYKFTYAGKSASIVGVDLTKYASIVIADSRVSCIGSGDDAGKVLIAVYDANGILVSYRQSDFYINAPESGDYYVDYDRIYFYEAYKSADVEIVLPMGFDANGNKIEDLKTTGTLASVDKTHTSGSDIKNFSIDNWSSEGKSFTIAVGDGQKSLAFKYDDTNYWGGVTEKKSNEDPYGYGYTLSYVTTNDSVLLVDEFNGNLWPVSAGNAQVVVYRYASWIENPPAEMMGVCSFTVLAGRNLASVNPEVSNIKLSTSDDDVVTVYPHAVDQTNNAFYPNWNIRLVSAAEGVSVALVNSDGSTTTLEKALYGNGADATCTYKKDGWNEAFEIVAESALDYPTTVQFALTATDPYTGKSITKVITLNVKEAGDEYSYALDSVSGAIDLNLPGKQWWANLGNYFTTEIKLNAYDNKGYLVKTYAGNELDNGDDGANTFFYTIKKGNKEFDTNNDVFEAISVTGGSLLVKIDEGRTGTYTVRAYKKMGADKSPKLLATKNIVVTDSTVGLSAIQKDNKLTTAQATDLTTLITAGKLEFKRAGKGVTVSIIDEVSTINRLSNGETRVYVTKVKVSEVVEMPWDDNSPYTFEYWVNVGKVFEVVD